MVGACVDADVRLIEIPLNVALLAPGEIGTSRFPYSECDFEILLQDVDEDDEDDGLDDDDDHDEDDDDFDDEKFDDEEEDDEDLDDLDDDLDDDLEDGVSDDDDF